MKLETMQFEKEGFVGRLTLNRPHVLNAINFQGTVDLKRITQDIYDDPDLRVIVILGAGRAFCSGIDLKELSTEGVPPEYFQHWDDSLRLLERAEKLVLCAIHGYALGGGLQLPLACDIRIATADCVIGLPAAPEAFIPGLATSRLPKYIGLGRAKHMILSGENIDGKQAHQIGLVDHLVDADKFDQEVEDLVQRYLGLSSEGTRQSKVLLTMYQDLTHEQFFEEYKRRQVLAVESPDHREAMAAYREGPGPRIPGCMTYLPKRRGRLTSEYCMLLLHNFSRLMIRINYAREPVTRFLLRVPWHLVKSHS